MAHTTVANRRERERAHRCASEEIRMGLEDQPEMEEIAGLKIGALIERLHFDRRDKPRIWIWIFVDSVRCPESVIIPTLTVCVQLL